MHRRRPEDDDAGRTAESEELGSISMEKGEFGFNVGKGENDGEKENPSHSGETAGTEEQTVGANETRETKELANIAIGEDDFGYNAGALTPLARSQTNSHPQPQPTPPKFSS